MCTVLLPPVGYKIAVNKYIIYILFVIYCLAVNCAGAALLITFYTDVKLSVYTWLFINRIFINIRILLQHFTFLSWHVAGRENDI